MTDLWDVRASLSNLDTLVAQASNFSGVDISTVRADSLEDSSLGNLVWVLIAKQLQLAGAAQVQITDYRADANTTKKDGTNKAVVSDLASVFEFSDLRIQSEEEVGIRDTIWTNILGFANDPHSENYGISFFPNQKRGFQLLREGEQRPQELERTARELTLFTQGSDQRRIQLMHHEQQTMHLIRNAVQPRSEKWQKEYAQIDLSPVTNEYRGKIGTIGNLSDKVLMGNNQDRQYSGFYAQVFDLLVDTVTKMAQTKKSVSDQAKYIVQVVSNLNPSLAPLVGMHLVEQETALIGEEFTLGDAVLLQDASRALKFIDESYSLFSTAWQSEEYDVESLLRLVLATYHSARTQNGDRVRELQGPFFGLHGEIETRDPAELTTAYFALQIQARQRLERLVNEQSDAIERTTLQETTEQCTDYFPSSERLKENLEPAREEIEKRKIWYFGRNDGPKIILYGIDRLDEVNDAVEFRDDLSFGGYQVAVVSSSAQLPQVMQEFEPQSTIVFANEQSPTLAAFEPPELDLSQMRESPSEFIFVKRGSNLVPEHVRELKGYGIEMTFLQPNLYQVLKSHLPDNSS